MKRKNIKRAAPSEQRIHVISAKAAGRFLDEAAIRNRWSGDPMTNALLPENEQTWRREVVGRNEHERTGFIRDVSPLLDGCRVVEGRVLHGDLVMVVPGHENDIEVIEVLSEATRVGARVVAPRDLLRGVAA